MKEFDSKHFKMSISDDLLKVICVKKDMIFDEHDVKESKEVSLEYKPGGKFYVLLESEENASTTAKARQLVASLEYSEYTAALALCSSDLYHKVVGNLFLKINKSKVPTRCFDNRENALTWLRSKMPNKSL